MAKNLLTRIGEAIDQHWEEEQSRAAPPSPSQQHSRLSALARWFLPNGGTLLLVALLIFTQSVWAGPGAASLGAEDAASTGVIAYQGRIADISGNPINSTLAMSFRLYKALTGGAPLWIEQYTGSNAIPVSDGLFNVMLGRLTPIPQNLITDNSTLFLGVTVGTDDEMSPRVQLGSSPFAVQALTVPDGSITKAKLAGDVSFVPPDGSITAAKLNLNSGLTMSGRLSVNGEITGSYFCGGHTNTDGTGWVVYEDPNANGIYIDVDTSGCNFPATPMYFASLVGGGGHWTTTGATSIYSPSATGFRVYVRGTYDPISPTYANNLDWHIQWIAVKQKTTGLDKGLYSP